MHKQTSKKMHTKKTRTFHGKPKTYIHNTLQPHSICTTHQHMIHAHTLSNHGYITSHRYTDHINTQHQPHTQYQTRTNSTYTHETTQTNKHQRKTLTH